MPHRLLVRTGDRIRRSLPLLPALAAFALPAPAAAYFDSYLSTTIIGTLTPVQARSFSDAVGRTLVKTEDGASQRWQSPAGEKGQPVQATLTPVRSKTDKGQECRQIRGQLRRGTSSEQWMAWFCKQPDGKWKSREVTE
ncbi:hypothetical protein [Cupriavidus sp. AU9028]|uniref:hypothetical protein n=1 Tax=Cupriavidus sp. AU9028 TaxID=2871157 RepID=UPI001C98388F|nr:hypothetical protein [Cupriavidus sp. AU9028]MBY4899143.1 hypothetical protein [Cupriavidus sp. AU9028]